MRIIKEAFLVEAAEKYPKAAGYLKCWRATVRAADWTGLLDVRKTYPSTDGVKVKSGRQVFVFNVCGNDFRLVVAIHFDRQAAYLLRFMTHAEYSKEKWKDTL